MIETTIKTGFLRNVFDKITDQKYLVDLTVEGILFVLKVIACVIIYYLAIKIVKKLVPVLRKASYDKTIDKSLRSFIRSILNVGLHAVLITICLLILGVRESSLFAFFGTLGIGVGLALKDNLTNLAGGIIILIFKTYKVGDEVTIAGELGWIYDIDIFFTSIRTHNDEIVIIPNGLVVSNKLTNYDKTPTRRLKIIIGVDYNCDLGVARAALEKIFRENPLILKNPEPYTNVDSYGNSSINIALKGWVLNENYWHVYKQTLNEIKGALDAVNVSIPFPQMDVHLDGEIKGLEEKKTVGDNPTA